jgi:hypothetical protein
MIEELAVQPPKLAPSDLELSAIAEYRANKKPMTDADLQRLSEIGKQEPEVTPVTPVADADLSSAIAQADAARRAARYVEGRTRAHGNHRT